jgi:hypothetical protein
MSPVLVSLSILSDCLPERKFRTFYLSPKNPSMKRTMTTAPTNQMMLFMRCSLPQTVQHRKPDAPPAWYAEIAVVDGHWASPEVETAVAALKAQRTAYQEQMKKVRDASDAALADLRRGSERMAEEFAKAYAQAFGQFAT